jgi:hypothetical protein
VGVSHAEHEAVAGDGERASLAVADVLPERVERRTVAGSR